MIIEENQEENGYELCGDRRDTSPCPSADIPADGQTEEVAWDDI